MKPSELKFHKHANGLGITHLAIGAHTPEGGTWVQANKRRSLTDQMAFDGRVMALAPKMLELLRSIEWEGHHEDEDGVVKDCCSFCGAYPNEGHTKHCQLNAVFKEVDRK